MEPKGGSREGRPQGEQDTRWLPLPWAPENQGQQKLRVWNTGPRMSKGESAKGIWKETFRKIDQKKQPPPKKKPNPELKEEEEDAGK